MPGSELARKRHSRSVGLGARGTRARGRRRGAGWSVRVGPDAGGRSAWAGPGCGAELVGGRRALSGGPTLVRPALARAKPSDARARGARRARGRAVLNLVRARETAVPEDEVSSGSPGPLRARGQGPGDGGGGAGRASYTARPARAASEPLARPASLRRRAQVPGRRTPQPSPGTVPDKISPALCSGEPAVRHLRPEVNGVPGWALFPGGWGATLRWCPTSRAGRGALGSRPGPRTERTPAPERTPRGAGGCRPDAPHHRAGGAGPSARTGAARSPPGTRRRRRDSSYWVASFGLLFSKRGVGSSHC